MLYYRFRPSSELSFKELLYSEIYFASTEECNDPFDSKSFYEFEPDFVRWKKLFEFSLGKLSEIFPSLASNAAEKVIKDGAVTFDDVLSMDFIDLFRVAANSDNPYFLNMASASVMRTLNLYKPQSNYYVSFSKRCDEPLMWSHYANRHEGFCLVFRSIDGALHQNKLAKKDSIRRDTPNSFSPSISQEIPSKFLFQDIEYPQTVELLNAFDRFPQLISMRNLSEEERITLVSKQESHYFQKHNSWGYEEESRITLRAPHPWLFGDRIEYTPQERLLRYEPSQLVGLILGARMSESNKTRIRQIIEDRSEHIARQTNYKRVIFDFLLQEAKLSTRHRQITIAPIQFIGRGNSSKPGDENFSALLDNWKSGDGIEIDGTRATRVNIPN